MKILSWNTEKGPITKLAAIETIIRRVAPDVAFLYEASNAFHRPDPYPDWLNKTFSANYDHYESPHRSPTGPTGLVVLITKNLDVTVKNLKDKRYAIIERSNGGVVTGLHLPSPSQGSAPATPPFFLKLGIASSSLVTGDFNQVSADPAVISLIAADHSVMNPNPRIATSTKGRPIDHTLAKPGQVKWIGYENTDFTASDHVAQVFEWV